ncbi:hypothetical protein M3P05_03950 [Sansalvadorimonas sp. 2012CJ34-2]|uniref:Transmembrane protein n=1 Tax=Parendozoicomonas callyspongiae TaxID=2942213 RepID=A0ABT0PCP1_9GAMM|nr:hypothetical protein [Sansalvadorimonas sp. 2012CJ34-2]MCL6269095.1 hypothetical protein [Sansalvadorimonas sp. 2012CJ34-2]
MALQRSHSLPAVITNGTATAETQTEPTAGSKFCGYVISIPGKVKSFFQSAPHAVKAYAQSVQQEAVTAVKAFCKCVKAVDTALWFGIGAVRQGIITTGKYFKSGAYGAAFGCLGGMIIGTATGALFGYGLGSVGSPIVGITTGGFCALVGAGIGAMTCATGGSLVASFYQYRDNWKSAMSAKEDEIKHLKDELSKRPEPSKVEELVQIESKTA